MDGGATGPVELVVVGHVADPRYWACQQSFLDQCHDRFVADRLVWADGYAAPDTPLRRSMRITKSSGRVYPSTTSRPPLAVMRSSLQCQSRRARSQK